MSVARHKYLKSFWLLGKYSFCTGLLIKPGICVQEQNSGTWGPAKCVTDVRTDIFYDLLFYRLTATWSLFDLCDKKTKFC